MVKYDPLWPYKWLFNRERKHPGSVWSLAMCLTTFILLTIALGGLSSASSAGIKSVFVMQLDFSNANWQRITPGYNFKNDGLLPTQRMNLYNNCDGQIINGDFNAQNPYRTWYSTALDPRYIVTHQVNSMGGGIITKRDVVTPSGTVIPRVQSGTIVILTTIACVLNGIAFFTQLFGLPFTYVPKMIAVLFLFVANIMVHVLAKRMMHSFNTNYRNFGVQAELGNRYLAMVWNAFSLLLISMALQFAGGGIGGKKEDTSPKFDPEAMKQGGYLSNYDVQRPQYES